jgi:hypothetical protein
VAFLFANKYSIFILSRFYYCILGLEDVCLWLIKNFSIMQAVFKNTDGQSFTLGGVSLTWIDVRNIFDSFQEDNNYTSEVIFKCTGDSKLKRLSNLIKQHLQDDTRSIREDIRSKLFSFCDYLSNSKGVELKID